MIPEEGIAHSGRVAQIVLRCAATFVAPVSRRSQLRDAYRRTKSISLVLQHATVAIIPRGQGELCANRKSGVSARTIDVFQRDLRQLRCELNEPRVSGASSGVFVSVVGEFVSKHECQLVV